MGRDRAAKKGVISQKIVKTRGMHSEPHKLTANSKGRPRIMASAALAVENQAIQKLKTLCLHSTLQVTQVLVPLATSARTQL